MKKIIHLAVEMLRMRISCLPAPSLFVLSQHPDCAAKRRFATTSLSILLLGGIVLSTAGQEPSGHYFKLAIAEPLRHQSLSELSESLKSCKRNGYNAIWIENDYLR